MSNVIDIKKKVKDNKNDEQKRESRTIIYDKAVEIERRCVRLKQYAIDGNRDAFLWSNIAMLNQNLDAMNEQVDKLIDNIDFDGDQDDDWDSESQDRTE
jgi:hypothetical protein|tara:strand:- start:37 stop:333 length:297 start_codon:yes stop_codon:yes gene_type:complete